MDLDRIRARIADIAANPKNVRFEELSALLDNHIGPLYPNYNHRGHHHHAFTLGEHTFNIAKPHSGFVKRPYIRNFLEVMEALGLHGCEGDDSR